MEDADATRLYVQRKYNEAKDELKDFLFWYKDREEEVRNRLYAHIEEPWAKLMNILKRPFLEEKENPTPADEA